MRILSRYLFAVALLFGGTAVQAATAYRITDLGALTGFAHSAAHAINDQGQIAGSSFDNPFLDSRAIVWQSGVLTGIPDSLGNHFFNYGLTDARTDVTLFFLEQECGKKKKSPWIIINVDLYGLGHGYGNVANYIPSAGNKNVRAILGEGYQAYFRVPFIRYYGQYENYVRDYLNNRIQLTKFPNKGAAIEKKVLTETEFNRLVQQRRNSVETFVTDTALLHRLLHVISSHPDRYFVFVVSPYHSSYFEKYANPQTAEAFLNELRSYKNARVFDYGKMGLPDSLFFNTSHLNLQGAVTFCRSLKDSLTTLGIR